MRRPRQPVHPRRCPLQAPFTCEGKNCVARTFSRPFQSFLSKFISTQNSQIARALCKVPRSQRRSRNQPSAPSPSPIRTSSIWLRGATVRRRKRCAMRWRIPRSSLMRKRTRALPPTRQSSFPRSLRSLRRPPVRPVHQPCSINFRPAIFSRTSSSNSVLLSSMLASMCW